MLSDHFAPNCRQSRRARWEKGNWPGSVRETENLSLDRELTLEIASAGYAPRGLHRVQGLPRRLFFNIIVADALGRKGDSFASPTRHAAINENSTSHIGKIFYRA